MFGGYLTGELCLVHVVPAVGLVVLGQRSTLVLAQFLHWSRLHQHPVDGDRLLLNTEIETSKNLYPEYLNGNRLCRVKFQTQVARFTQIQF